MLAVLVIPGAVLNWVSGLRLPWAVAASLPTTAGVIGFAGWVLSKLNITFTLHSVVVFALVVLAFAAVWRLSFWLVQRRNRNSDSQPETKWWHRIPPGSFLEGRWVLPIAGIITGAWLIIAKMVDIIRSLPHEFESIVQGWDVHWHASEVRYILEVGMADSTRMGEAQNIDGQLEQFYPSGWHAVTAIVAQVMGLNAIEAINWMNILLPAVALPLSVAVLAWRIVGDRSIIAQVAAGFSAAVVVGAPVLYWIPSYVGMWPYLGSISMASIVAVLFTTVPYAPIRVFATVIGFSGVVIMHPAPVTIIVLLVALWWLLDLLWRPSRDTNSRKQAILVRLRDVGLLAVTGLVAVGLLAPQLLAGMSMSSEVQRVSAYEDVTRWESLFNTVAMRTRHTDGIAEINWTWLVLLALVGIIAMIVRQKNLWAPVFLLLCILLTANALKYFPAPLGDVLNVVSDLHYGTAHRLVVPVSMLLFAFAGVGVASLAWLVFFKIPYKPAAIGLTAIVGILTTAYMVPIANQQVEDAPDLIADMYAPRMVTDADLKAFTWLAKQPKAYEGHIFGEPADGYGWMYAYNGLPSVSRHYFWQLLPDNAPTETIHSSAYLIGAGNHDDPDQLNKVDEAVNDLGVNYIFISLPNFWYFQYTNLNLTVKIDQAPGLTKIYQDGPIRIYAVNNKFTDPELTTMRKSGSPEPLPPVPTYAEANATPPNPALADQPYYHRSTKPPTGLGPDLVDIHTKQRHRDYLLERADRGLLRSTLR